MYCIKINGYGYGICDQHIYDTHDAASEAVQLICDIDEDLIGHAGDLMDGGDRTLFWSSAADAKNDAGQNAIGQIIRKEDNWIT